jgi:uncharacterized protein YukE
VLPFPEAPQGDPGAISGCASTLRSAADDLEHAESGLHGASGSLQSDWQGFAAQAYHAASNGLAAVVRGGAETFRECAAAVSKYGADLDHVQSQLRHLKQQYEDAVRRETGADGLAGRLQGALAATTKQPEITKLGRQIGNAEQQAQDAVHEANGYALRAQGLVTEFKGKAQAYAATLNGQDLRHGGPLGAPFSPPGTPGSGFGIPNPGDVFGGVNPDGLDAYAGVIPVGDPWNSFIPGYGIYMDATHGNLTSPDDLTNLIVTIATLGGGALLRNLAPDALRAIATELGIGGAGRAAAEKSGQELEQEIIAAARASGATRSTSLASVFKEAGAAGDAKAIETELAQTEVRGKVFENLVDLAGRLGAAVPPGMKEVVGEITTRGWIYSSYARGVAGETASTLLRSTNPAVRAIGRLLGNMLNTGR